MPRTAAQKHRAKRGRRYTKNLRKRNANLQKRLDNAVAALERVTQERRRLPAARKVAESGLAWEAAARTRAEADDD